MRIDGPPPQGGGDCSVDGNGKLPSSCFDWVARALVPSAAPGDDDDERRSRLRREQVREEYRVAYASLAGMKKRRLRKDCCNYEDGLLRGLCFGYWTCIEAGKQRCQVVKEKLDTLPQQISVLDAAIRRVAEGSIGNDVEDWKLGADFVALMAGTAGKKQKKIEHPKAIYEEAYNNLSSQQKERMKEKCLSFEYGPNRGFCYAYMLCLVADLLWCSKVKSMSEIMPGQVAKLLAGGLNAPSDDVTSSGLSMERRGASLSSPSGRWAGVSVAPRRKRRRGRSPPPPCMDLNPRCPTWARDGECAFSPDYMKDNCPLSCDWCNPALSAAKYGVDQQTDFAGYSIAEEPKGPSPHSTEPKGNPPKKKRSSSYVDRRVRQVVGAMEVYLESDLVSGAVAPQTCSNRHPHCALWTALGYCDFKRISMQEICPAVCHACKIVPSLMDADGALPSRVSTSRSSAFARMDLLGIFEALEEDRIIIPNDGNDEERIASAIGRTDDPSELTTLVRGERVFNMPLRKLGTSVYRLRPSEGAVARLRAKRRWSQRGIFPRTVEEERSRKVRSLRKQTASLRKRLLALNAMAGAQSSTGSKVHTAEEEVTVALDKERATLDKMVSIVEEKKMHFQAEMEALSKDNHTEGSQFAGNGFDDDLKADTGENYADGPFVARFDTFLSQDECDEILSLLKINKRQLAAHAEDTKLMNSSVKIIGDDGFAPPTKEMITEGENARPVRSSSRIFFDPRLEGQQWYQESEHYRFDPIFEQLLTKIEVITSIPAAKHAEMPILFEKFDYSDLEGVKPHFSDVPSLFAMRDGKPVNLKSWISKERVDAGNFSHPTAMRNARVFKMVIFLSDVEKGGEIVFPIMGNLAVEPAAGRALLIPSVLSLVGEKEDEIGMNVVDDPVYDANSTNRDGTCLVEDMETISEHRAVQEGTKYVVTIWLRRFPVR